MLKSSLKFTASDGRVWTVQVSDYGSGDTDYVMIEPDGNRNGVKYKWENGHD